MQLQWLIELQNYRNSLLDIFFHLLHFFDTFYFLFLFIPFILVGISYRWGVKIYYLIVLNGLINHGLKTFFKIPRPSVIHPDLALVSVGEYSFPSGAAQFSIILASLLIYFWKSPIARVIGVIYVVLIGFSRIYLGVHYPTDIVTGWVFGLIVIILFFKCSPTIEKIIKKNATLSLIVFLITPLIFMALFPDSKVLQFSSSFLGIVLGSYFAFKYRLYLKDAKTPRSAILRGSIAVLSTFALYFFFANILNLQMITKLIAINFILSIWIVLGISPLIKKWIIHS